MPASFQNWRSSAYRLIWLWHLVWVQEKCWFKSSYADHLIRKYFVSFSLTMLFISMEITQELVSQCHSFAELTRKLGRNPHTRINHQLKTKLIQCGISFDHFTLNGVTPHDFKERVCPICQNPFIPKYRDEQVTCSYSCSNTYFARKRNDPSKYKNYRTICWYNHAKKCVVCQEDKIVAVHHMDEDKTNNDPKNLVPLCPTHHGYWHSRYRSLIQAKVDAYLNNL